MSNANRGIDERARREAGQAALKAALALSEVRVLADRLAVLEEAFRRLEAAWHNPEDLGGGTSAYGYVGGPEPKA